MANVMSIEKRNTILRLLVEGNSIRSTCRLMGSQIHTVLRQLEWAGQHCEALLNDRLQGLTCRHLEVDEIWTYVGRKQANLTIEERATRSDVGDLYLFTAQDQDSRLIACHLLGKRSADNTRRFMVRLADNLTQPDGGYGCPQISVDGFPAYPEAVDLGFGKDCKLGVIIKEYRNSRLQYDPSEIVGTKRKRMRGAIEDRSICTSHVERNNLTIRTFMKRFCRLTIGFSRKIENLEAAVNLHMAYFNFCWRPGTMKVTPAQAAGLTDHCWTFDELLAS
jgi:IS1 family transposase